MGKLIELKATNQWECDEQEFIENVYLLQMFANHYGRDERYYKHFNEQLDIIGKLNISDKLVLPYIGTMNGKRTVVLLEFDLDKNEEYFPGTITKGGEFEVFATLETKE